jgi:hypothetical protein
MLQTHSSHRAEGPSSPLPRCTTAKKAVKLQILQFTSQSFQFTSQSFQFANKVPAASETVPGCTSTRVRVGPSEGRPPKRRYVQQGVRVASFVVQLHLILRG